LIETKELDKNTHKNMNLDNYHLTFDKSGLLMATSNQDKYLRIKETTSNNLIAKI